MNTILQYSTYLHMTVVCSDTVKFTNYLLDPQQGIMGGMTRRNILLYVFMATDKITGIGCDLQ